MKREEEEKERERGRRCTCVMYVVCCVPVCVRREKKRERAECYKCFWKDPTAWVPQMASVVDRQTRQQPNSAIESEKESVREGGRERESVCA